MKSLLFLLCITLSTGLYAQSHHRHYSTEQRDEDVSENTEDEPTIRSWEMAINSTYLLRNLSTFGGSPIEQDLLVFRKYFNVRDVMKFGFKYDGDKNVTNPNDSLSITRSFSEVEFTLGYERYNRLAKRWRYFYGIDFGYGMGSNDTKYSVFDPSINNPKLIARSSTYFTIEPAFGVQFYITPRVSLSTRTTFLARFSDTSTEYEYFDPTLNYNVSGSDRNTNFTFPSEIFLRIRL